MIIAAAAVLSTYVQSKLHLQLDKKKDQQSLSFRVAQYYTVEQQAAAVSFW